MYTSKILLSQFVTHDVKRFVIEKPEGYSFSPGQATEVAINAPEWEDKKHPFTFTSLNNDLVLEFIIKGYPMSEYPEHTGMTEKLHTLEAGDELLLDDPWGTIEYKGPGVFIAGGVGITPFIAILRQLKKTGAAAGNTLIFSNKTQQDIVLEKEWRAMFEPDKLILTLTREENSLYEHGRVDEEFLRKYVSDFSQDFYLCGPKAMVKDLRETLGSLGARTDAIVFEQ